jgi:hypothetical protein
MEESVAERVTGIRTDCSDPRFTLFDAELTAFCRAPFQPLTIVELKVKVEGML